MYYTGPSEDLVTRPGRMWWSVPEGDTEFGTWRELSTVYHEGVPGHHLQIAQTVYRKEILNRWMRVAAWVSGHGEGWALYAERLMADLGFLDDPADYLGMLDGQSLRAARVVLDIGIHCGLPGTGRGRRRRVDVGQGMDVPRRALRDVGERAPLRVGALSRLARARRRRTSSASGCGCSCARTSAPRRATRSTWPPSTAARWMSARSDMDVLRGAVLGDAMTPGKSC